MADIINPSHYKQGNIIKCVLRYKYKNGLDDLKKAQWYINKLVEGEIKNEKKSK